MLALLAETSGFELLRAIIDYIRARSEHSLIHLGSARQSNRAESQTLFTQFSGVEARVTISGNGRLPISHTQYGRIAVAICYDVDFPQLIRQVGRAEADVLLAPANDWEVIKHLHFRMAIFRAIENGTSMVRATKSGLSGAVDAFGRTLALTDHFSPGARIMIAQVPLTHVSTIYTRVGDLFAWLCIASLLIMIAVALRVVR